MSDLSYPSLAGTVLPIFLVEGDKAYGFCGSGVLLDKGIFITCWHCVSASTAGGKRFVVGIPSTGHECTEVDLRNVERDASGADLAVGLVDAIPRLKLILAPGPFELMGHDVWSFGYPYTDQALANSGGYDFTLNGRILRGYVTRTFPYDHPSGQQIESYELDMPAPSGMSGGPLILRGGLQVIGVVFGTHDVETVDEESSPRRCVQTNRVVSFGLAHTAKTLRDATTGATNGMPLAKFLEQ
jgi:hypothetical protein